MQSLFLGENQWIKIDREFDDAGTPARMAQSGGLVVEMAAAVPAKPRILMARGGFYYANREPVTDPADVAHLPDGGVVGIRGPKGPNYRAQAEAWIKKMAGKAPRLPLTRGHETEDGQPIPPDRGRSLRGREVREIDSPEQAERELVGGAAGLQQLDRDESRRRTL